MARIILFCCFGNIIFWVESWNSKFNFGILQTWGCGGQAVSFMWKLIDETQMPIALKHVFKEKSRKLLILLPLRTIYFRTFHCETPCSFKSKWYWKYFWAIFAKLTKVWNATCCFAIIELSSLFSPAIWLSSLLGWFNSCLVGQLKGPSSKSK